MRLTAPLLMVVLATPAFATGWNDFERDLGDGYRIFKANSIDVVLLGRGQSVQVPPPGRDDIGPIVRYAVTNSRIVTRHVGLIQRPNKVPQRNPRVMHYFIVNKADGAVAGPFDETAFASQNLGDLPWRKPTNPNIVLPLLGTLMMLGVFAVIYGWPLALIMLLFCIAAARRAARPRKVTH